MGGLRDCGFRATKNRVVPNGAVPGKESREKQQCRSADLAWSRRAGAQARQREFCPCAIVREAGFTSSALRDPQPLTSFVTRHHHSSSAARLLTPRLRFSRNSLPGTTSSITQRAGHSGIPRGQRRAAAKVVSHAGPEKPLSSCAARSGAGMKRPPPRETRSSRRAPCPCLRSASS